MGSLRYVQDVPLVWVPRRSRAWDPGTCTCPPTWLRPLNEPPEEERVQFISTFITKTYWEWAYYRWAHYVYVWRMYNVMIINLILDSSRSPSFYFDERGKITHTRLELNKFLPDFTVWEWERERERERERDESEGSRGHTVQMIRGWPTDLALSEGTEETAFSNSTRVLLSSEINDKLHVHVNCTYIKFLRVLVSLPLRWERWSM